MHIDGHPYAVAHIDAQVAILDIAQPGSPTLASKFRGTNDLAVTEIDGRHYVLAGRYPDPGFTIVDITDPASPSTVASVTEGYGTNLSDTILNSITAVEIDGTHYAVTASSSYIVVTDITDPADPSAAGSLSVETGRDPLGSLNIHDGVVKILGRHYVPATSAINNDEDFFAMLDVTDPSGITAGRGGGLPKFDTILGARDATTIEINGIPYALVAISNDNGFQIIDMSDPSSPIPVASVTDGHGGFNTLGYSIFVDAAKIGDRYYALVISQDDRGIQIIDITNPKRPSPAASVTRATPGFGGVLFFSNIAVTEIGGHHYALVDDANASVHVINVTKPKFPKYVSNATNGTGGFVFDGTSRSSQPRSGAATTRWSHPSTAIACR